MKTTKFGNSRFSKFLRHNGVFVALAVGMAAVCLVGLYGAAQNGSDKTDKADEQPVEQLVTNQPDERTTTSTVASISEATTTATAVVDETALYVFPLTNTVQKTFSADTPSYSETMKDWRLHLGVDFAGEIGQTVKAAAKGTVSAVEEDRLWGNVVTVDHGLGVISRYCGVSPSVKVGDEVDVAAPIGKLADIPCESAQSAHLHLEILVDDTPVDPVTVIGLEVRYGETTDE